MKAQLVALVLLGVAQAQPPAGKLLVAGPKLTDVDFAQSVILLLRSDPQGAIGVMINLPTDVRQRELLTGLGPKQGGDPVYKGGPMRMGINAVVRSAAPVPGAAHLTADLYVL